MSRYIRKTDRGITDFNSLLNAIKEVKIDKKSMRSVAISFGIPKSSLQRYISKLDSKFTNISEIDDELLLDTVKSVASYATPLQIFNKEEEEVLAQYVKRCCNYFYGLNIAELRELAYQFARKMEIRMPLSWTENKIAGKDWYYSFMERHSTLTLRTSEQTSLNRIKGFSKENVDFFFANFEKVLEIYPFQRFAIWNMDETGFSTVPSKVGKIIAMRGVKRIGQVASQERGTMITMALAVNAEGNSIPPMFLFPRKKMQSVFMDNASPGAIGVANESGWMQQNEFLKFIEHFIQRSKSSTSSPTLLLLDNHQSHLSIEALDMAAEHGVTLLSFPPHCSHKLQPLDVSVYGPLKSFYKLQCNAWMRNNAFRVLEIRHIPGIVATSLDLAVTPRNIKAGFEATGIAPYNPNIFSDSDFIQNDVCTKNVAEEVIAEVQTSSTLTIASAEKPSTSHSDKLTSILNEIGPLQPTTPKKKSNRGRKSMQSTILTSTANIAALKEKKQKFQNKKARVEDVIKCGRLAKKIKIEPPSPSKNDTCHICDRSMPRKLTRGNSVGCSKCKTPVHLRCANSGLRERE